MDKCTFILLLAIQVLGKSRIDVSVRLAENLCVMVENYKDKRVAQGELKSPKVDVAQQRSGDPCMVWRWTKCDHKHPQPCTVWEKVPCRENRTIDPDPDDPVSDTFCAKYQCGWTLDELNLNWGYNPEHVYPVAPDREPILEVIDTGATLDFPFMRENEL